LRWTGRNSHGAAERYREEDGAASCRVAHRVSRARAGGEDAVQGRVEAIRRRQHYRAVAMGAGATCVAPLPRAPTVRHGEDSREKGIRTDRRVPHGSERRRKVGDSWAGWLCWAARHGGLRLRRTRGGLRGGLENLVK
jgi:hypothetical protein